MVSSLKKMLHILFICSLVACSGNKSNKSVVNETEPDLSVVLENDLQKARLLFYALPSPIETAMLIKRANAPYNEEIMNPTERVSEYHTSYSCALNFGIYGADLSYASLFSQTQTAINYMSAIKKLASQLGILDLIDANMMERMEANINQRDSLMQIINESFITSNDYLKEAGRAEMAALIITGGWIEGLYLATSLAKKTENSNELIDRIIDQKLSLVTLQNLLETHSSSSDIRRAINLINDIKKTYDKVKIVSSKLEPLTRANENYTTLQAKTEIFISDEVFQELCFKTDSIRNHIISLP